MAQTANSHNHDIKLRIEKYWNGRADEYDTKFGHGIFSDREKQVWLGTLKRNLRYPQGAKVLDVGCGTGFLSLLLAELGFAVTGVDFAEDMMAEARKKAAAKGLAIDFLHGDAESPPVPPKSFQAVVSRHLLWTLPNPEKTMANWMNLLAPGGQVVVIDGVWTPRSTSAKLMYKIADLVAFLKGKRQKKSWEKEYLEDPGELPFMGGAEPERVLELFHKTGFERVKMDNMSEVIDHEKKIAPLEYSLRFSQGRCRYLVTGSRAD